MKLMKRFQLLLLVFVALIMGGCATVGKMPVEMDLKIKEMKSPEGKALVYIVRPSSFGFAIKMTVTCDGEYVGTTAGKRYIYTVLSPGNHLFVSKAENKSELSIVLEEGKTYYLEQQVKMGLIKARNKLVRLDEVEGRNKLSKCSLSDDLGENR